MSVTLLTAASLLEIFWFHAMAHSTYLINKMPSRILADKSPYFRLFHKLPEIKHLRIFDLVVFPCLRPFTKHELQPRSSLCVFLGYVLGYKIVLCYNMENHKILISRNVIHDESLYHFKGRKVSPPQDTSSVSCMPISVPSVRNVP